MWDLQRVVLIPHLGLLMKLCCKGIRLMLEVDHCNEEERRLSREWSALQEWFSVEWQSVQVTLEHADKSYKYHLQSLRDNLVAVYVNWEAKVRHIPHAWIPSRPWGPRAEEIAGCLVAANNPSVISAAEDQTEGSLKDYDSDGEGLMSEGGDNLLLSIEEMALEEEYSMGEADEEQSTEDEEWLQDIENGSLFILMQSKLSAPQQEHLKEDNNVKQMVTTGSKASYIFVLQMMICVGQQSVEGKEFKHKYYVDVTDKEGGFLAGVLQIGIDKSSLELQAKLGEEYACLIQHCHAFQTSIVPCTGSLTPYYMAVNLYHIIHNAIQIFHIDHCKPSLTWRISNMRWGISTLGMENPHGP
ncbi:hypothetical protein BKA82DRAFT_4017270 [Pisolithus tinctorius]|nr:hypothetical protein BKA82DRAFT_4017270 [Pisolithus tinctorius]